MTAEVSVHEDRALYTLVDDLSAYTETLAMLDAELELQMPDEQRAELEQTRQECIIARSQIGAALAGKTDAIAMVLRRLGVERDFVHSERERLQKKERAVESAIDWLRGYVVSVMEQNGMKQLKTASNTLFLRASEAVEVTDAAAVPDNLQNAEIRMPLGLWRAIEKALPAEFNRELQVLRVKAEPSLSTIKRAIKAGERVPGADLRQSVSLVCR